MNIENATCTKFKSPAHNLTLKNNIIKTYGTSIHAYDFCYFWGIFIIHVYRFISYVLFTVPTVVQAVVEKLLAQNLSHLHMCKW